MSFLRASLIVAAVLGFLPSLNGQETAGGKPSFSTVRRIGFSPQTGHPEVAVAEFFTHGELRADGANLAVSTGLGQPVPWRVLQVGPGDFCRVAFQSVPKQMVYKIQYGGNVVPPESLPWTSTSGLLLETRRWAHCNLGNASSVRSAFASAKPIGSDYVSSVFHGVNPFHPEAEPFLTLYRGTLFITRPGKYEFFTSSQDCSFLEIDGKTVVASSGAHGPVHQARIRGDCTLTAGPHPFEYLHAASGGNACMVAAWQPPGVKKPEVIPAEAFHGSRIAHVTPGQPHHVKSGTLPDFMVEILGEAPLADNDLPLVRVRFRGIHTTPLTGKIRWEFGDGLTSVEADPMHVYLHPGLFKVKVATGSHEAVNRIQVYRGGALSQPNKAPDQLTDYLPIVNRYNAPNLDPLSALQLIRFCEQFQQHNRAVMIGQSWLTAKEPPDDEAAVKGMAEIVGPILRDRQDDPAAALAVYRAAANSIQNPVWKPVFAMAAADVCLHDLHQRATAKKWLEMAGKGQSAGGAANASRMHRLWGDWHARAGNKKAALLAYEKATKSLATSRPGSVEREARRGAYSRSTEAFLREKSLDRARDELRRWQDEFPEDKIDGYLPLLLARYYVAGDKFQHAIVVAGDLLAVNAESPYADQLVFLAAECEENLKHIEQARAGYRALLADYPGSPLVREAKQKLSQLSKTNATPAAK